MDGSELKTCIPGGSLPDAPGVLHRVPLDGFRSRVWIPRSRLLVARSGTLCSSGGPLKSMPLMGRPDASFNSKIERLDQGIALRM